MESKQKTLYMSRQLIEFNHIYKEFNDVYREAATKVGLSLSGFDILYAICEMGDGCLQRDISQMCCIPKQTVNSSIRKLEQDRYLILEKGKGRDMHIHLTEKGQKLMEEKSDEALYLAIKGMLPKNSLGRKMLKKVRIYKGAEHNHEAQQPEVLNLVKRYN